MLIAQPRSPLIRSRSRSIRPGPWRTASIRDEKTEVRTDASRKPKAVIGSIMFYLGIHSRLDSDLSD